VTFTEAIRSGFRHYVTFSGRASRSEFWYWALFTVLAGVVAAMLDAVLRTRGLQGVLSLVLLLPNLAISVRRLHDSGKSGWLLLIFGGIACFGAVVFGLAVVGAAVAAFRDESLVGSGLFLLLGGLVGFFCTVPPVIYLLYLYTRPSEPAPNRYGPMPGTLAVTLPALREG
jgi:uncharacterized membrane protein YhaH (DUF805 family)